MGDSVPRRRPPIGGERVRTEKEKEEKIEITQNSISYENCYQEENDLPDRLNSLINNITLEENDSLSKSLEKVVHYFKNELESPGQARTVLLNTYKKCLEDREFCVKTGVFYGVIHTLKIGEETARTVLLSAIQKELEDNNFLKGNRPRFRNAIFLLSELYFNIQFDGNPISILGAELLNYFRWLLTGDDEELEILAICLIVNGSSLKKDKPVSYMKILLDIRVALVTRNLSTVSKCWLLLILDEDNVDFSALPDELHLCHMTLLGDKGFHKLKRLRPSFVKTLENDVIPNTNQAQVSSDVHSGCMQLPALRRPFPGTYTPPVCSSKQLQSSEQWDSPDQQPYSDQQTSDSLQNQQAIRPIVKTTQRWSLNETNRVQRSGANTKVSQQLQGNSGVKTNTGGQTLQLNSSDHGGHKTERRIAIWQHEHDDRLNRDYSS